MSVKNAVLNRRATKVYLNEEAPSKADLDLITDAVLWAPTPHNLQNSAVLLFTGKEIKREVSKFFHEANQEQVDSAQVVFIFLGTPWEDNEYMKEMLIDHSISHWGLPNDEMVENIANGTVDYYTNVNDFTKKIDILASGIQAGMLMLQASELGYDTNGLAGIYKDKLETYLKEKGFMSDRQRVNMAVTMGHGDKNHERNKLAHNRIEKARLIKEIK